MFTCSQNNNPLTFVNDITFLHLQRVEKNINKQNVEHQIIDIKMLTKTTLHFGISL
jgi:hypothetical protein